MTIEESQIKSIVQNYFFLIRTKVLNGKKVSFQEWSAEIKKTYSLAEPHNRAAYKLLCSYEFGYVDNSGIAWLKEQRSLFDEPEQEQESLF